MKSKAMFRPVASICLAAAVGLSAAQGADAATSIRPTISSSAGVVATQQAEIERTLRVIDQMPDRTINSGEAAIADYLASRGVATSAAGTASGAMRPMWGLSDAWRWAKCGAALITLVAGIGLPITTIVKIKKLIKAIGGTQKLAKEIVKTAKQRGPLPTKSGRCSRSLVG